MSRFWDGRRRFETLSEQEVLALAISSEEDDARIFADYAARLEKDFPASAVVFREMAAEEDGHRRALLDEFTRRFGAHVPLIRREHVAGFYERRPTWLVEQLGVDRVRAEAARMEGDAARFYEHAASTTSDAGTRRLLGDLAQEERGHQSTADQLVSERIDTKAKSKESETAHRQLVLTWVQPGLAGLMDGTVSTLAPIFATAFATHDTRTTLLVGLAAAIGAGISMGFTEAAHDDGVISGRGSPLKRGLASGVMTTVGGLGHALPYLIPSFWTATLLAAAIVVVELWAIAWIQNRYMQTPMLRAIVQCVVGGALVFAAGALIGGA